MLVQDRLDAMQRALICAAVIGTAVVFWTALSDTVSLPKVTVALLAAALVTTSATVRVVLTGRLLVPKSGFAVAAVAFSAAMFVAMVASGGAGRSLLGAYGRYGGLLPYLSYVIVGLAVLRLWSGRQLDSIVISTVVGAAGVVAYGLLQVVGADPVPWVNNYGDAFFSTLGNPNFAAGYLGITSPLIAYVALERRWSRGARVASAVLLLLALLSIWLTDAIQGPASVGAGLGVVALAWALSRPTAQRRIAMRVWAGAAAVGAAATAVLLMGWGPFAGLGAQRTLEIRTFYWRAALGMFRSNPVTGVGPGRYGSFYQEHRPTEAAVQFALTDTTDAAHNVTLNHLAEGGLLLGAAWVAVVIVTGAALISGLRRLEGSELLMLGGLGGGWLAYQVQGLVSIDVPPLAFLHWVLAGAIIALAWSPPVATIPMPWAAEEALSKAKARQKRPRRRPLSSLQKVVLGIGAGAAAVLVWATLRPFRADLAYSDSREALAQGSGSSGLDAAERAASLAPWEATYHFQVGNALSELGRPEEALAKYEEAAARDPRGLSPLVTSARFADSLGQTERAEDWYRQALAVEPKHPEMKVEVAQFLLQHGQFEEGIMLVEEALLLRPEKADWWSLLGRALVASGDTNAGRRALVRALELAPGHAEAAEALKALDDTAG